ncbi:hypothetical protein GIB57_26365, partial [Pseudomonas tremae]|uniref:hypothetical protein n=1 Tax=Pseudomonas tremae TaxID=200454 RepID=UPI001F3EFBF8
MLIRIALPSDACGIGILYNQLVGGDSVNVTRAGIAELTTHRATLLVCEIDQVVAGTVLVQPVSYTQLPAHETIALKSYAALCLEKKKKKLLSPINFPYFLHPQYIILPSCITPSQSFLSSLHSVSTFF